MQAAINAAVASADPSKRAIGHNFKWDERLSDERIAAYEQPAFLPVTNDLDGLCEAYSKYYKERVEWDPAATDVAEPFRDINSGAALAVLPDDRRELVRMVKIAPTLSKAGLTYDKFRTAVELRKSSRPPPGAQATVENFVEKWNIFDQRRPAFVGFLEDVKDEVADPSWPDRIRNRFGIGHLHVDPGADPIPVMLLVYSVERVLKSAKTIIPEGLSMRIPTVLDANLYPYFFPAPTPLPFGRTVHLGGGTAAGTLTCELIHLPINISVNDIRKVGMVTSPIPDVPLPDLRDNHLQVLRDETGRDDLGEWMA
jgi:hypothetical protein